ncbi:hypothetical protein D3C87_2108550 [compost metagenome]
MRKNDERVYIIGRSGILKSGHTIKDTVFADRGDRANIDGRIPDTDVQWPAAARIR